MVCRQDGKVLINWEKKEGLKVVGRVGNQNVRCLHFVFPDMDNLGSLQDKGMVMVIGPGVGSQSYRIW